MNQIIRIILLSTLLIPLYTKAQQVSGMVMSMDAKADEGLPGVNIYWLGSTDGTVSDIDGNFTIKRKDPQQHQLVFSYVGFQNDTMEVGDNPKHMMVMLQQGKKLETVTVGEERKATTISGISTINQEKLSTTELKKAACCNLAESFETNASVDVMYADAVTGAREIRMLGLDGTYSQLMTENVPTIRGLASTYGLTYIPGTWVESIQISKGAGSVVNGYESMTGQINTEFKKPDTEKLFANLYVNHLGRTEANVDFGKQLNHHVGTMLFLSGSFFGTRLDANHDGFLDIPKTQQFNAMNRWRFDIGPEGKEWEIQAVVRALYDDRTGGQWAFDKHKSVFDQSAYGVNINTKRFEGFTKIGKIISEGKEQSFGWINNLAYHNQDGWYGHNQYLGKETNWYSNFIFQSDIANHMHTIKAGASFMLDDYREQYQYQPYNRKELVPGLFTEYSFNYEHRLSLMAGIRVDYHNLYGVFYSPRLHFKFNPAENTTIRLSAGRGYHVANIFAEHAGMLISERQLVIQEDLKPEVAWNFGINFTQKFHIGKGPVTFNLDLYHTRFENQVVMDPDQDVTKVMFYNLHGKSFSTSLQAEVLYEPIKGLELKVAYKLNDVRTTYGTVLEEMLLVARHKGLFNAAYSTKNKHWKFDATVQLTGTSRLPANYSNVNDGQVNNNDYSPIFATLNTQATFVWNKWEVYVGAENLNGYTQKTPIIGADDPFGKGFDASGVWAPIYGRIFYMGVRFTLK